jgi:hypothetical protein
MIFPAYVLQTILINGFQDEKDQREPKMTNTQMTTFV